MRKFLALTVGASFLLIGGCTTAPTDDVGRSSFAICCGTGCCCGSLAGDPATPLGSGDMNPANACEMCDPSTSQTSWTAVPGCMAGTDSGPAGTDAGPPDSGGGCAVSVAETTPFGAVAILGLLALFVRRRRV